MSLNAEKVRKTLQNALKESPPDCENAFFALVKQNTANCLLNNEPAVIDGWRVLFAYFDHEDIFLFAMSHKEKQQLGFGLSTDPSCPEWLHDIAEALIQAKSI